MSALPQAEWTCRFLIFWTGKLGLCCSAALEHRKLAALHQVGMHSGSAPR